MAAVQASSSSSNSHRLRQSFLTAMQYHCYWEDSRTIDGERYDFVNNIQRSRYCRLPETCVNAYHLVSKTPGSTAMYPKKSL